MKYRAIISDIDGTCIPNAADASPSPRVVRAIKAAQKNDVFVSVCTGRPIFLAKNIIESLRIQHVSGINDGTQLYDPIEKKILASYTMKKPEVQKVIDGLQKIEKKFMVNYGETEVWYTGQRLPDEMCGLCVPEVSVQEADSIITHLTHIPNTSVRKSPSHKPNLVWVTITSPRATKLHQVMEITKTLGVGPEEVIGIGDGYNDFPLLEACGLKVAMGNAVEELKTVADFIAPSVEEDGFAVVIEKFILDS